MKYIKLILFAFIILSFSLSIAAQTTGKKVSAQNASATNQAAKSSPAYAEILLRKTERESQLEEFLIDYTEDFPKIKELRFELDSLQKESSKILATNAADAGKLTLALGKLIVRQTELETDWWNLRRKYNDEHPEVKRAKRKVEVFERAVREILQ